MGGCGVKSFLKPSPEMRNGYKDSKRLAAIHEIACAACERKGITQQYPTEVHHKIGLGLGLKASDRLTTSLCDLHHSARFIRDEDKDKINGWAIHKTILEDWQAQWGTQDDLIALTDEMLGKL